MGRIGRLLQTKIEKFIIQTVETRYGYNQLCHQYGGSGDDAPPIDDDRIVLVKVDGTGDFAAVGVLTKSRGAKAGEKFIFSRNEEDEIQAIVKLLNNGKIQIEAENEVALSAKEKMVFSAKKDIEVSSEAKVKMQGGGSDKSAARKGDTVEVEIPAGSFIVSVQGQATGTPNPLPVKVTGTIKNGSGSVEIGD